MLDIQTVLFPTDDSDCAAAARPVAEALAERYGATLHVLRVDVVPPAGDLRFEPDPRPDVRAQGLVKAHRRFTTAGDAIVMYAEDVDADLVVMGTHGRTGWSRLSLGSTAEHVLRRAPCPVLTVGPEADAEAAGPVLVPLAFESASDVALETAAAVAEGRGARLVALHVVEPVEFPAPYGLTVEPFSRSDLGERVERALRQWVEALDGAPVPTHPEIRRGDVPTEILAAAAEHGAGLVVQASHGRRGPARWLLGSVAEAVARRAPCPVLTLRVDARPLVRLSGAGALPVPRADWPDLFDALSARAAQSPHVVTVRVLSPAVEGVVYEGARLHGLTYDPNDDAVEVLVEGGGHHVVRPFAVRTEVGAWALDAARDAEAPGPWTLDVVRDDGMRERIEIRAVGEAVPA
jgi:nucleotide-binding universal stress UspA family protein